MSAHFPSLAFVPSKAGRRELANEVNSAIMAEGGGIIRYTYRGEEGELIPREATHITVLARVILEGAFQMHPNIIEVICHDDVEKIEDGAFYECHPLRRITMRGVTVVEEDAFQNCPALTDVECNKLEIISEWSFCRTALRNLNLPSARIVKQGAFHECDALTSVKFGNKLERIQEFAFVNCTSLERITIPLKDGFITADDIFEGCRNLIHVDLVKGELHKTIAALQLKAWRINMNEEIDSINQILPATPAGDGWDYDADEYGERGEKTQVIRRWIRSVLRKINHYQEEHRRIMNEAAATLQLALPCDILTNNVLPFLELPSHSFGEAEEEDLYVDSQEDSNENGGEEDYLGEERNDNNVEQEEDQEEYDEDETAQRGRGKRQRT